MTELSVRPTAPGKIIQYMSKENLEVVLPCNISFEEAGLIRKYVFGEITRAWINK